jgi:hypothetical protein
MVVSSSNNLWQNLSLAKLQWRSHIQVMQRCIMVCEIKGLKL